MPRIGLRLMPRIPEEPVDVVIPVRTATGGEHVKLDMCCKALRAYVPVNQLIMVTADCTPENVRAIDERADIPIIDKSAIGVGRARRIGLNRVETSYYASVDSDVLLSENWYRWAIATVKQAGVGACQGYSRPQSRFFERLHYLDALSIGRYVDLGNTMLSTELVRKVGMPDTPAYEDEELRRRLASHGYSWITNPSLISTHLLSDSDIFRHAYHFGTLHPEDWLSSSKKMLWISRHYLQKWKRYGLDLSFYLMLLEAVREAGSIVSHYRQNPVHFGQ